MIVTLDLERPRRRIHVLFHGAQPPDDGCVSFEVNELREILDAEPEPEAFEAVCREKELDGIDFD